MLTVLQFQPGYQVPVDPGNYILIDEAMQYIHAVAMFSGDEFLGFRLAEDTRCQSEIPAREVLGWAQIKTPGTIVQSLYSQQQRPAQQPDPHPPATNVVRLSGESRMLEAVRYANEQLLSHPR